MADTDGVGRVIGGRYRLVADLGSGGFGRVWKAHDEALGVDVAIKEVWLPPGLSPQEQAERLVRAEREARNAAKLRDHPNIVAVHDVVPEDGVPWIVMQLIDGASLQHHLATHGPLSVDQAAQVATALLRALEAADQAGIVHRDVKPGNVLISTDGHVLLTDFGIAAHREDTALTSSEMVIGSAEYMAPERAHQDATVASDLFSLGVTLYQAVEGSSPFRRDSPAATMAAVLSVPAPPPTHAGRLEPLITRLLDKQPGNRPTIPQSLALATTPPTALEAPSQRDLERELAQLSQHLAQTRDDRQQQPTESPDEHPFLPRDRSAEDWRALRSEPFASAQARRAIARLASRMRETLWRSPDADRGEHLDWQAQDGSRAEPPTHVVDAFRRGDFATVSAAIQAAAPGDRILVRPGLYEEGLVVDKPLEILGDGAASDIEIRARGAHALLFQATIGRVANVTLRQAGGDGDWFGVEITQGRLDLEGCDISSQSLACVAIRNGADPRLRGNKIHDGKNAGVFVYEEGRGMVEDNDITANSQSGVTIKTGGNPTVRRNKIHDGKQNGVFVLDEGRGMVEDNDITANTFAGVAIATGGDPTVRGNRIHDGKQGGVYVYDEGRGMVEDNDITANTFAGVQIKTGGNPTVRHNRIYGNASEAVRIHENGRGVIKNNDLTGNKRGPWDIAEDCKANVTRAGNKE